MTQFVVHSRDESRKTHTKSFIDPLVGECIASSNLNHFQSLIQCHIRMRLQTEFLAFQTTSNPSDRFMSSLAIVLLVYATAFARNSFFWKRILLSCVHYHEDWRKVKVGTCRCAAIHKTENKKRKNVNEWPAIGIYDVWFRGINEIRRQVYLISFHWLKVVAECAFRKELRLSEILFWAVTRMLKWFRSKMETTLEIRQFRDWMESAVWWALQHAGLPIWMASWWSGRGKSESDLTCATTLVDLNQRQFPYGHLQALNKASVFFLCVWTSKMFAINIYRRSNHCFLGKYRKIRLKQQTKRLKYVFGSTFATKERTKRIGVGIPVISNHLLDHRWWIKMKSAREIQSMANGNNHS